ncbi:hypothetical protein Tco_0395804, partial [Tanacetum coccineum]
SDVNVLGPGVLDIVAAESNITTVHPDMAMYSASVEITVPFCFFDDQLTNLSPRN